MGLDFVGRTLFVFEKECREWQGLTPKSSAMLVEMDAVVVGEWMKKKKGNTSLRVRIQAPQGGGIHLSTVCAPRASKNCSAEDWGRERMRPKTSLL